MKYLSLCNFRIMAGITLLGAAAVTGGTGPSLAANELRGLDDLQRKMVTDKAPQQGGAILVREEIMHVRPHARVVGKEAPQPIVIPNIVMNPTEGAPPQKPQLLGQGHMPLAQGQLARAPAIAQAPIWQPMTMGTAMGTEIAGRNVGMGSQDMQAQVNFDAIQQRLQDVGGMKIDPTQNPAQDGYGDGDDYGSGYGQNFDDDYEQNVAVSMAPDAGADRVGGNAVRHKTHYVPMPEVSPFMTVNESGQLNQ